MQDQFTKSSRVLPCQQKPTRNCNRKDSTSNSSTKNNLGKNAPGLWRKKQIPFKGIKEI